MSGVDGRVIETSAKPVVRRSVGSQRLQMLHEEEQSCRRAEVALVRALNAAGIPVTSVWDLVKGENGFPASVPILLEHLPRPYPRKVREGIARALAMPDPPCGWRALLAAFRAERDATSFGPRWALALAVSAAAPDGHVAELLPLLHDPRLGCDRVPLVWVLGRSRDPRVLPVLDGLRSDPTVGEEAARAWRQVRKMLGPAARMAS